jgi:hypothetical protein
MMGNLTEKFEGLETQLGIEHGQVMDKLTDIESTLGLLNESIDILINNGATNTRYILAALGAMSPCAPCPTPSLTVPPVDTTPNPVDEDKCKRTQAFLHAMTEVYTVLDTISAFSVPFSPTLISDAIEQVITALANGDATPLPSFPEAVNIGGDGINYAAGNFLVGDSLVALFAPIKLDLRDAIYSSSTPADAKAAFDGAIDGSSVPSYAKPLMRDAAYNALVSYYFDPASDPNLAGYSGTVCGFSGCIVLTTSDTTISCGGAAVLILWEPPFSQLFDDGHGCTSSDPAWTATDLTEWTITPTQDVRFFYGDGTTHDIDANDPFVPEHAVTAGAVVSRSHPGPFDVEFCHNT